MIQREIMVSFVVLPWPPPMSRSPRGAIAGSTGDDSGPDGPPRRHAPAPILVTPAAFPHRVPDASDPAPACQTRKGTGGAPGGARRCKTIPGQPPAVHSDTEVAKPTLVDLIISSEGATSPSLQPAKSDEEENAPRSASHAAPQTNGRKKNIRSALKGLPRGQGAEGASRALLPDPPRPRKA